ncbi:MAG: phosphoglycerate dehydrogenase [Thermaerobacter sp.]|nr:phosphoglycerate dehydrogenase [Thermaerobacter sp.]
MTRPKILVTEALGPKGLAYLAEHAEVDAHDLLPPAELPGLMGQYDAVIIRSAHRLTRELMTGHPRLKVVARAGAGVDNVDLTAATELGLAVINAPGANAIAAAEHSFGLMLAVMRNIRRGDLHVREGGWNRQAHLGQELHGKRLGIIGLGRVGRQIARIAHGFRMEIYAYDPFITPDIFTAHNVTRVETLDDLFPVADVLTLHTPKTGPHLGKEQFRRLPPGAVVINAARGGLMDEEALFELLDSGHLGGVGLDVFTVEPPPRDFRLFNHPNVVLTPHLGGSTHEALAEVGMMTARGVIEALQGLTPPNIVNVPIPDLDGAQFRGLDQAARILGRVFAILNPEIRRSLVLSLKGQIPGSVSPWMRQAVLAALLSERMDDRVNTVNALIKAEQQGIRVLVEEEYAEDREPSLHLRWEGEPDSAVVVGLNKLVPTLKMLGGIPVELPWPDRALITRHRDAPGVVGLVGTLVGQHQVNIGNLYLGRNQMGQNALMVLTLDTAAPPALVAALKAHPEIEQVYVFE